MLVLLRAGEERDISLDQGGKVKAHRVLELNCQYWYALLMCFILNYKAQLQ